MYDLLAFIVVAHDTYYGAWQEFRFQRRCPQINSNKLHDTSVTISKEEHDVKIQKYLQAWTKSNTFLSTRPACIYALVYTISEAASKVKLESFRDHEGKQL